MGDGTDRDDRLQETQRLYERAVFGGDADALAEADRHLNAVEADLSLARGRVVHARFVAATTSSATSAEPSDVDGELVLFERARQLYRDLGDLRGEAEAQFWIGTFHQVVRRDDAVAVPALEQARVLATRADDPLTLSYVLRHLGIARHRAGELEEARSYLEESTRLRRLLGFGAGVAANLVGLAYVAAGSERRNEVAAILDEASALAQQSAAAGISRQIDEARQQLVG